MKDIKFRPAELNRDFAQLAAWYTVIEDEPNTETGLQEYYEKQKERTTVCIAEDEHAERLGFYWASRDKTEPDRMTFTLYVKPDQRRQGIGGKLYNDLLRTVSQPGVKRLRVMVPDTDPNDKAFAERRGFVEKTHHFGMQLNLKTFNDRPFDAVIAKLKNEGFQFTSMEELGNTEEAQRKLYRLNDATSKSTPGTEGESPWLSFEDFQKNVCQTDWYIPAGQKVVIDTTTGAWAAMSAITRFKDTDYAYNLMTGVDIPFRGRKLGQAVKVTAIRFAREVLKVDKVRTHHNMFNKPMIAIDQKLGYVMLPGTFRMEKNLGE
jgi:GNAT superfamily N-acetyltransferase/RimJ/RimL family protein N-acetyltransferase